MSYGFTGMFVEKMLVGGNVISDDAAVIEDEAIIDKGSDDAADIVNKDEISTKVPDSLDGDSTGNTEKKSKKKVDREKTRTDIDDPQDTFSISDIGGMISALERSEDDINISEIDTDDDRDLEEESIGATDTASKIDEVTLTTDDGSASSSNEEITTTPLTSSTTTQASNSSTNNGKIVGIVAVLAIFGVILYKKKDGKQDKKATS